VQGNNFGSVLHDFDVFKKSPNLISKTITNVIKAVPGDSHTVFFTEDNVLFSLLFFSFSKKSKNFFDKKTSRNYTQWEAILMVHLNFFSKITN